jgi:hypothetical protein
MTLPPLLSGMRLEGRCPFLSLSLAARSRLMRFFINIFSREATLFVCREIIQCAIAQRIFSVGVCRRNSARVSHRDRSLDWIFIVHVTFERKMPTSPINRIEQSFIYISLCSCDTACQSPRLEHSINMRGSRTNIKFQHPDSILR